MKYKVGDKVRIKNIDWYNENKDKDGRVACGYHVFTEDMSEFCGKIMIICKRTNIGVMIMGGSASYWTDEMIDCLVERNGKPYPYKIGDRVILKGKNRLATITDLKYNSSGNLVYYVKIDNDKDISIDYPTDLLLPCDNVVKEETKPKFKVGDRVKHKDSYFSGIVTETDDKYFKIKYDNDTEIFVGIRRQDEYELILNKFDITTLKPFDKVLIRQCDFGKWEVDFFGYYDKGYHTTGRRVYAQCIPYEGNEHLLSTSNKCDDFYKTWK